MGQNSKVVINCYTTDWSLLIVGHVLHQEKARNFKGIIKSATPKQSYSPFLQSQFCIKRKEIPIIPKARTQLFQFTKNVHDVSKK